MRPNESYLQNLDSGFHQVEEEHYWYTARRDAIVRMLRKSGFTQKRKIRNCLEVGCGTGGMLPVLAQYANEVVGVEPYEPAVRTAKARHLGHEIHLREGADFLREHPAEFELIASFDVLEHVEHDEEIVAAIHAALAPGGHLVLTVPASRMLWSSFDVFDHHYRRYSKAELTELLKRAGFTIQKATYFYMSLFPAIFAVRKIRTLARRPPIAQNRDVMILPPRWVNWFIKKVLALEVYLIRFADLPFGSSIFCVARKDNA